MKGINLIINQYTKAKKWDTPLIVTRSGTGSIYDLHFTLTDYSYLLDKCNEVIPIEWQNAIDDLYKQERAIITKRTELMTQYKKQFPAIVAPIIEQYQADYPEEFI